jgi:hypothetical protein
MLKKGDDDDNEVNDEVDDEVRTTVPSQNGNADCTKEFFVRTQHLYLSSHQQIGLQEAESRWS